MKIYINQSFKLLLVVFISTLSLLVLACTRKDTRNESNNEKLIITDAGGNEISLPRNITKIACATAAAESVVISLGAAEKLIATSFDESYQWAYVLFPELKNVRRTPTDFNAEAMIASGVEVVLVRNTNKAYAETLMNAGLSVVQLDFSTLESTAETIKIIGMITGKEKQSEKYAELFNYYTNLVSERLQKIDGITAPTIHYIICRLTMEPTLTHTYPDNFITSQWIKLAGGAVITEGMALGSGLVEINMEELLASRPEYIFVSGVFQSYTYDYLTSGEFDNTFSAVKDNKVIRVPLGVYDWGQAGVEACLITLWCAKTLYQGLFDDIDLVDITQSFYRNVMGVDISKENVIAILSGKTGPESH